VSNTSQEINKETEPQQAAIPVQKRDSGPESISDVFHDLLGIKSKFKKLKSFFRTRRLIIRGKYLFDHTRNEIKQNELMGPLTFNIYSSTIAATVALIVTKLFSFFFPHDPPSSPVLGNSVRSEYVKIMPHVEGFLRPFLIPVVFLFVAYVISWGTIRKSEPKISSISYESTPNSSPSRIRGRNAFLYFDGAYGLVPQALASLAFSILAQVPKIPEIRVFSVQASPAVGFTISEMLRHMITAPFLFAAAASIMIFCAVIYQASLTYYKYPTLLFRAYGYYSPNDALHVSRPPWIRYILTAIFLVPLVSFLIYLLYLAVAYLLSISIAAVFAFLHRIL